MPEENTITITLPAIIKAHGSDKIIEIVTADWADPQAFAEYLLTYSPCVIMQRASAGKNDDTEKAKKAVEKAIERLMSGVVPAGGGFTKLSPEDYAMKETLMASKVKFEKGESVADVLERLAVKLGDLPKVPEGETHDNLYLVDAKYVEAYDMAVELTQEALETELQGSEVYKSALKARKAKAKTSTAAGSLMGKL